MRLKNLKESAPGVKGKTTPADAQKWLDECNAGTASEKDMDLFKKINNLFEQIIKISKTLGGKTTVSEVLKTMLLKKL